MISFNDIRKFFGLALDKDLTTANENLASLTKALAVLNQTISKLEKQKADAQQDIADLKIDLKNELDRQKWCSRHLIELPVDTSLNLRENTLKHLQVFLGKGAANHELPNLDKFSCSAQWSLYWCLAHASQAAWTAARAAKDEDGISRAFLAEIGVQAKKSMTLPNSGNLQIAFNSIFEQSEPGMKEAAVGADILLIVTGSSLVPNGMARIFWIQAKKAKAGESAFKLHYDYKNAQGLQIEKLSAVNVPARGSFGFYMQYSCQLPYITAVDERHLPWRDGVLSSDLSQVGTRLPEFLVARTTSHANVGAFQSAAELRAYLDQVSEMKPLYIVKATAEGYERKRTYGEKDLLTEITDYYLEKFGLPKAHEHEISHNFGR